MVSKPLLPFWVGLKVILVVVKEVQLNIPPPWFSISSAVLEPTHSSGEDVAGRRPFLHRL